MIVCDTGPLFAALNANDTHHDRCALFLSKHPDPIVVPGTVVSETCYFLEDRLGPHVEAQFLQTLIDGYFQFEAITRHDLARMAELVRTYADFPLGAVDASVIAVAERLGVTNIAPLDRRHFSAVCPSHAPAFHLLPY